MPCYDSRNEPAFVREEALKEFTHNSPVAELLCYVMKQLSAHDPHCRMALCNSHQALAKWWADHQVRDAEKARKERQKEAREQASIRAQIAELQKKLK